MCTCLRVEMDGKGAVVAVVALVPWLSLVADRPYFGLFVHSFLQEEARLFQEEAVQAKQEAQEALRGKDKARC